jgi:hypothetical protein
MSRGGHGVRCWVGGRDGADGITPTLMSLTSYAPSAGTRRRVLVRASDASAAVQPVSGPHPIHCGEQTAPPAMNFFAYSCPLRCGAEGASFDPTASARVPFSGVRELSMNAATPSACESIHLGEPSEQCTVLTLAGGLS